MSHDVAIIITLSVIIFVSPYLSKIFRIPTTPIEIVLGSFAASIGFITDNHYFELIAEVGFFYLMFLAGTEVNLKELQNIPKKMMQKNIIYIILLYLFAFIFVQIFDFSSVFIVILPLISVGLILTLYKEFDKDTKWLNLSMTTGIMGELVSIITVTIAGTVLVHGVGLELYASLGYLILFLVTMTMETMTEFRSRNYSFVMRFSFQLKN